MELSKKFVFVFLATLALAAVSEASQRIRHRSFKRSHSKNLKKMYKTKEGGSFCDNHCVAVFIYPSTTALYINKVEIPQEDDNHCNSERFDGPNQSLKLSESVKQRFPELYKGVYPGRPYESGENFEILRAQYSQYLQDIHLLYGTSDIDVIGKCYFGGTKEPYDPCSYTKACGASFGGASCVKFDGHCHSTCSACCFLSAIADTIKDTESVEQAQAESTIGQENKEKGALGEPLEVKRKHKKGKSVVMRSHKGSKTNLAQKRHHKKEDHAPVVAESASTVPADAENVVNKVEAGPIGGGTPPGVKIEKVDVTVERAEIEQAIAGIPKHGLGFRADPSLLGSEIYFDKCENVQHIQNCRDGQCDNNAVVKVHDESGDLLAGASLGEPSKLQVAEQKKHNKRRNRRN